jgi:hypothetical protein
MIPKKMTNTNATVSNVKHFKVKSDWYILSYLGGIIDSFFECIYYYKVICLYKLHNRILQKLNYYVICIKIKNHIINKLKEWPEH